MAGASLEKFLIYKTKMNNTHPDREKSVICRCSGTTTEQIKRLIERGIDDLEGISRATGACSGCGACDTDILEFLAEHRSTALRKAQGQSP